MIATCRLCSELITPAESIHGVTAKQFAALPAQQRGVLGLTAAITAHLQQRHGDYYGVIAQLTAQCSGVLSMSTVDMGGVSGPEYAELLDCDRRLVIEYLAAAPSAPAPDVMKPLQDRLMAAIKRLHTVDPTTAPSGLIIATGSMRPT